MLTLKLKDLSKLFSKENYTGKKIIDPEADDLILEEALKRRTSGEIKITVIVKEKFSPSDKDHFRNKFKEYYLHRVEELVKVGKRQDRKYLFMLQKGLVILLLFLSLGFLVTRITSFFTTIISEITLIAGWVAIWKPLEYFLFHRQEHTNLISVCENLTKVDVELVHEENVGGTEFASSQA
ncbi:MAG: hypothetical protein WCO33_01495 [bacterium]